MNTQRCAVRAGCYAAIDDTLLGKHRGFDVAISPTGCPPVGQARALPCPETHTSSGLTAGVAVVLAVACLAGCGVDAPPTDADGPVARAEPVEARPQAVYAEIPKLDFSDEEGNLWLSAIDTRDPLAWLETFDASPEAGTAERRAERFDLIARLNERYIEDPRMLANRTVQLQTMLGEVGVQEDMHVLLRGFAGRTQGVSAPSFGEIVSFYVTLRAGGASHEEALEQLAKDQPPAGATPQTMEPSAPTAEG